MKAYPSNGFYEKTGGGEQPQKLEPIMGMDLRDYFAAKAMQALVSLPDIDMSHEAIAELAYKIAIAMMEARGA